MRKLCLLLVSLCLLCPAAPARALSAEAASAPLVDWAWLSDQVASGAETIKLPGSIAYDGETPLAAKGTVVIEGGGFTLTGAVVSQGSFHFRDTQFQGVHGLGDEDGGAGLTVDGEGTIVVLSGTSRAVGGRSGQTGERGGDGVLLMGDRQGLILRNTASALGGIGALFGGAGVRVLGREASVLLTDSAGATGNAGLAEGGSGLNAPACCRISLDALSSAGGGRSVYTGGDGVRSAVGEGTGRAAPVSIAGTAMISGGIGDMAGSGVFLSREAPGDAPDLLLADAPMLFGGDGGTGGPAIRAERAAILAQGAPMAYAGGHYAQAGAALALTDCKAEGLDLILTAEGVQLAKHPGNDISLMIQNELALISDRYVKETVEDGLTTRKLSTKLSGMRVESGRVTQAAINDGGLKITMRDGEYVKRLEFTQRLSTDGAEGLRLVLIAAQSQEWLVVESTAAALRKLVSLGFTQLACSTASPVYYERIWDLETLLQAIDGYEGDAPVQSVLLGTADDTVIFVLESGAKEYQEDLMADIVRPLEAPPTEE